MAGRVTRFDHHDRQRAPLGRHGQHERSLARAAARGARRERHPHGLAAGRDRPDRRLRACESENADLVIVTGGLGGTPDDVTREALAAAFEAPQDEVADLAERLRSRFPADPEYAARWANLRGARPLENPLGGAPGFVVANVFVLPGLPAEMKAMFGTVAHELQTEQPITSWRRVYETTGEDRRRPRGAWATATQACSSARIRSSTSRAPRSRSS